MDISKLCANLMFEKRYAGKISNYKSPTSILCLHGKAFLLTENNDLKERKKKKNTHRHFYSLQ